MIADSDVRLGRNGAEEIKAHPFFEGFDWEGLGAAAPGCAGGPRAGGSPKLCEGVLAGQGPLTRPYPIHDN